MLHRGAGWTLELTCDEPRNLRAQSSQPREQLLHHVNSWRIADFEKGEKLIQDNEMLRTSISYQNSICGKRGDNYLRQQRTYRTHSAPLLVATYVGMYCTILYVQYLQYNRLQ
jgi:hypothetical protein